MSKEPEEKKVGPSAASNRQERKSGVIEKPERNIEILTATIKGNKI